MTVSRAGLAQVLVRAVVLAAVGALTLLALRLGIDHPPIVPRWHALLAGMFVGVFALAPLVVERAARRWAPSWRRDLTAALLAWLACALWGVPAMIQGAHVEAVAQGSSLEGAHARALQHGSFMLAEAGQTTTILFAVSAVFFAGTLVALRPGRWWRDVLLSGAGGVLVACGVVAVGSRRLHPMDALCCVVLVATASLAGPLAHRLADRVERRVAPPEPS